jgi:hypothetical protein
LPLCQVTENVLSERIGSTYQSTLSIPAVAYGDAGKYSYEVSYEAGDNFQGGSLAAESTKVVVHGE